MENEEINKNHDICFDALKCIKETCESINIPYYLLAGTTLGAVRHGGFIPWDDDVDGGIRVGDYARFDEEVKKHLPEGFVWTGLPESRNYKYPRMYGKILYNGRGCVDVFRIAKWPDNAIARKILWKLRSFFIRGFQVHIYEENRCQTNVNYFITKVTSKFLTQKFCVKALRFIEALYEHKKTDYYVNIYSIYVMKKEMIKSKWLDETSFVNFNGEKFQTVGDTHNYLQNLYGDYMKLPPESERNKSHEEIFEIFD